MALWIRDYCSDFIKSAAFSAIIIVDAYVLADGQQGIIDASAILRLSIPWTFKEGSTTAIVSFEGPIFAVPHRCHDEVPTWPA